MDEVRLVEDQVADKKIKWITGIVKERSRILKMVGIKTLLRTIVT